MDAWDLARAHFEMYRVPSMNIKGSVMTLRQPDPEIIMGKAEEYAGRLSWLMEKFEEIGNYEVGYYIIHELSRIERIKADAKIGIYW